VDQGKVASGLNPGGGIEFTSGSVFRHLVMFSVPMLVGNLVQTAYNIVNTIWVGNGLGTEALAAMTISFPVFFLLMAMSGGISQATSILAAQSFGARDHQQVRIIMQNSLLLVAVVAIICVGAGVLGCDWILGIMQTPAEILPQAASYLHIFIWTTPWMFGFFLVASALRGVGDSRTPLRFQVVALLVTTILDPILMFGWFGLPRLGLNGTAWATIIAQAGALFALSGFLIRQKHLVAPDPRGFRFDPAMCLLILRIGIPTMLQQGLISVGMVVMISLVNGYGAVAAAAFGAAMRIDQFAFLPAMTISMAVATLTGQNLGAGKIDRVGRIFRWGLVLSCALTSVATALAILAPTTILRLFIQDEAVILAGARYLRIVGPGYLIFTVMFIANGVINGSGHTLITTGISLIGLWGVRLPLAAWLSQRLGRVEGVWIGMVAGLIVGMTLSLAYYFSGRWRRVIGTASPSEPGLAEN
jgi:putative MATE family efflux protein